MPVPSPLKSEEQLIPLLNLSSPNNRHSSWSSAAENSDEDEGITPGISPGTKISGTKIKSGVASGVRYEKFEVEEPPTATVDSTNSTPTTAEREREKLLNPENFGDNLSDNVGGSNSPHSPNNLLESLAYHSRKNAENPLILKKRGEGEGEDDLDSLQGSGDRIDNANRPRSDDSRMARWLSLLVCLFLILVAVRVLTVLYTLLFSAQRPERKVLFEGIPNRQEMGRIFENAWSKLEKTFENGLNGLSEQGLGGGVGSSMGSSVGGEHAADVVNMGGEGAGSLEIPDVFSESMGIPGMGGVRGGGGGR